MVSGGRGGVYRFTYEIVSRLSKKGYKFFVAFITGNKDSVYPSLKNVPFVFMNDPKQWRKIAKFSRIKKFDIIHSNFATPVPFFATTRKPIIFTCHGLPQPWLEIGLKEKCLFTIEKLAFPIGVKKATKVVFVSKFVQSQIASTYNICSQVIYHGIDLAIYQSIKADKAEYKKIFGINPKEKVVLYIGRLHSCKDPLTLVKSFGTVAKKHNKSRLVLVAKESYVHKYLSG